MFCIKELQLNKYRKVFIPRNKDLFATFGFRSKPYEHTTDVDNYTDAVNVQDASSKVECISRGAKMIYAENARQRAEAKKAAAAAANSVTSNSPAE